MPLLEPIVGQMIISLFVIWFGIAREPHFVSRATILLNAFTVFVILFTLDISNNLAFWLIVYVVIGLGLRRVRGLQYLKFWYGSKIFGSLSLAIGFVEWGQIENVTGGIIFWWAIFSACTIVIAMLYYRYSYR